MDVVRGFLHDWRLVLLIIHVGVTAAMIVVILLQRSEGGGLGMGRTDALFSVRGQANVLSRLTAIFATIFFALSLLMAWSMTDPGRTAKSIMDRIPTSPTAPAAPGGAAPAPAHRDAPDRGPIAWSAARSLRTGWPTPCPTSRRRAPHIPEPRVRSSREPQLTEGAAGWGCCPCACCAAWLNRASKFTGGSRNGGKPPFISRSEITWRA